jgi:hypothetical protein
VHTGDVFADPLYVNRAAKDFRLAPGSPCAGKGPRAPGGSTPADLTAPRIKLARRPRVGRRGRLVLRVRSDEAATARIAVRRKGRRRIVKGGRKKATLRAGVTRVVLKTRLRRGRRYRVKLRAADLAGNPARVVFGVRRKKAP